MNYFKFCNVLTELGFDEFYKTQLSNRRHSINYGRGKNKDFVSIIDAAKQYTFSENGSESATIDKKFELGDYSGTSGDFELLILCIEIFDWGNVQSSNIQSAIALHRSGEGQLFRYLQTCKYWFEDDSNLTLPDFDVRWSSGWTKVYSLLFNYVTIYDSRVAAFLNYVLLDFYATLGTTEQHQLKEITKGLLTFGGITGRYRKLPAQEREKLGLSVSPSSQAKMLANKQASWFIRYMSEIESNRTGQEEFRTIDKAAFMLGFDLSQLDVNSPI